MYTVTMSNGDIIKVKYFDGGGCFIGSDDYEVHGMKVDGDFLCILQKNIVKVIDDETGEEFIDFGNYYFNNHPYQDQWLSRLKEGKSE